MTLRPEFILAGVLMKQQLSGAETGGSLSLFENRSDGPSKTPIHMHSCEDETLFVLEGEMHAIIGSKAQLVKAGESAFLPRGIPHQLINASGGYAHYLLLCTPGGFERFLAEGGHLKASDEQVEPPSPADLKRLQEAAPRFGITLLPDW